MSSELWAKIWFSIVSFNWWIYWMLLCKRSHPWQWGHTFKSGMAEPTGDDFLVKVREKYTNNIL